MKALTTVSDCVKQINNMHAQEQEQDTAFEEMVVRLRTLRREWRDWMAAKDAADDAANPIHAILGGSYGLEVDGKTVWFDTAIHGRSVTVEYELKSVTFEDGNPPPETPCAFPKDKLQMLTKLERAMLALNHEAQPADYSSHTLLQFKSNQL